MSRGPEPTNPIVPAQGPSASATFVYAATAAALNQFHAAPMPTARTHQFEPGMVETMQHIGRLATAAWAEPLDFAARRRYRKGDLWLGRCPISGTPLGISDEKHAVIEAGSRGGKGETIVIPNHLLWEGSLVSIDPKGENASVTAARRGQGNDVCIGMKQHVYVLDPMRVATVEDQYRARYNPLDAIDPDAEDFIEVCGLVADALVVRPEVENETFWNDYARDFIEALILFVKTSPYYKGMRTLATVYLLAIRGDSTAAATINEHYRKEQEADGDKRKPVTPYEGLFMLMKEHDDDRCGEVVQENGEEMLALVSDKVAGQWSGFRSSIKKNMRFMKSKGLQKCTSESTFELSSIKHDPAGVSLYMCLPIDKMKLYNRWLRVMVTLIGRELRKDLRQPAKGRVLLFYDEFAQLGYLEEIETAFSTLAGYGGKMVIVLQDTQQLEKHYAKSDRTMKSCVNLQLHFNNEDTTCELLSKRLGETDLVLEVKTLTVAGGQQDSESVSQGKSKAKTEGETKTAGHTRGSSAGTAYNQSMASQTGEAKALTEGSGDTSNDGYGGGSGSSTGGGRTRGYEGWPLPVLQSLFLAGHASYNYNHGITDNTNWSRGTSRSRNRSLSKTLSGSMTKTAGVTLNETQSDQATESVANNASTTETETETRQQGHTKSLTVTLSVGQSQQKRPLIYAHDMLRELANIEDKNHPFFPGMALVRIRNEWPALVHRTPYYDDLFFDGLFDRHPGYPQTDPPPLDRIETLPSKLMTHPAFLSAGTRPALRWHIEPGKSFHKGDRLYGIEVILPEQYAEVGTIELPVHAAFSGQLHRQMFADGFLSISSAEPVFIDLAEIAFRLDEQRVEERRWPAVVDREYEDFVAGRHPVFARMAEIDRARDAEQARIAAEEAERARVELKERNATLQELRGLENRMNRGIDWDKVFGSIAYTMGWTIAAVVLFLLTSFANYMACGLSTLFGIGTLISCVLAIGFLIAGIVHVIDRLSDSTTARAEYNALFFDFHGYMPGDKPR